MKKPWLIAILLIILTAFSRLAVANFGYENLSFDSGNFALALKDYSIANDRPHLPGYFLYVQILKVLAIFSDSPAVIFAIIFSSLSAGILFLLFKNWLSFKNAALLALLIVLNPMSWFYTSIAEIYAFDLFLGAVLVLAGISRRWIYMTPLLMALAAGIRQSSPVLLLPLYGYLWWNFLKTSDFSFKKFAIAHGIAIAAVLAWFLPMANSTGSFKNYLSLWQTNNPVQQMTFFQNFAQFSAYGIFIFPPFIIAIIALPFKRFFQKEPVFKTISEEKLFKNILLFWLLPPLLFFIFFHYANAYFLLCIAALFGVIFLIFKNHARLAVITVISGLALQIFMFFFIPYRIPRTEYFFAPKVRKVSQIDVFKSRVLSSYLMGNSRIQEMGNYIKITENFIQKAKTDSSITTVFFDPSFPVIARALQQKSPLPLTTLNTKKSGAYYEYAGLSQTEKADFEKMLTSSVIATNEYYAYNLLQEFSFKKYTIENQLAFLQVDPREAPRLARLYDSLFVR